MAQSNSDVTCRKLISYVFTFYLITFLGALLFIYVEECLPAKKEGKTNLEFEQYLKRATNNESDVSYILNITKDFFQEPEEERCVFSWEEISVWWDFTIVTLYTIGLGTTTPVTDTGKVTLMFYAGLGIPVTIAVYTLAAMYIKQACGKFISMVSWRLLNQRRVPNFNRKRIILCFVILQVELLCATCITTLKSHGDLGWLDSYYFWVQCVSTIGYGDVYPKSEKSIFLFLMSKIISIFIIGIAATLVTSMAQVVYDSISKRDENGQANDQNCQ